MQSDLNAVAMRFIFNNEDINIYNHICKENPEIIVRSDIKKVSEVDVLDSASRFGYFLMKAQNPGVLEKYMP